MRLYTSSFPGGIGFQWPVWRVAEYGDSAAPSSRIPRCFIRATRYCALPRWNTMLGCIPRLGIGYWQISTHVCTSLKPGRYGILHFLDSLQGGASGCTAPWKIGCYAKKSVIFFTPESFNQIRLHIYPPSPTIVLPDKEGCIHPDFENLIKPVHLVYHRFDASLCRLGAKNLGSLGFRMAEANAHV